jgi:RNA polymerase sigma factor (TIGR02999 family)
MLTEAKAMSAASNITILPAARRGGDEHARDFLIEIVYDELRRLAEIYLRRERSEHTLQPTELINETYLKLVNSRENDFQNRAHFIGTAANAMRQILVDHARARYRDKRGGKRQYRVSITTADKFIKESDVDF